MSYDYHEYALSVRITEGCIRILIFTWCGLLAITFLYKLRRYKQNTCTEAKPISKQTTISALTTFICWFLSYLISSIDTVSGVFWEISESTETMIWFTFAIIFSIGMIASYMFVVLLLYQSFKGSQFEISKCTFIINIGMIIILCITCSTATFLVYIIPHWLGDALVTMNIMFYVFALCVLVCIINSKLIKAVLLFDNGECKKQKQNPTEKIFLSTITKLSVLMSFYTFTAIIYVSSAAIDILYPSDFVRMLNWILYGMLVITGTISQYLTFTFNEQDYKKICGVCHNGVFRCCTYIVSERKNETNSVSENEEESPPKIDLVITRNRVLSNTEDTKSDMNTAQNEWKNIEVPSPKGSNSVTPRPMKTTMSVLSCSCVDDIAVCSNGEDGLSSILPAIVNPVVSTAVNLN